MAKGTRKALTRLEKMLRSDGALCVTFVNTGCPRRKALATYADLLQWGVETGAMSAADAERLEAAAAERPGKASGVVRRARTLVGRLKRILLAFAAGGKAEAGDFAAFNAELSAALSARELAARPGICDWAWGEGGGDDYDRMLWPVLHSAGELLASPEARKVRLCATPGCGLLFVARGGGRPRKWCSSGCGNRATSRRHYHRRVKPKRLEGDRERSREERQRREAARRRAGSGASRRPTPQKSDSDGSSSS